MIDEIGGNVEGILTVSELIEELQELPGDARVMIAVVKYPGEFCLKATPDGEWRWDLGSDVEVKPLEEGEISVHDGQVWIQVELEEYNAERAMLNGATPPLD